MAVVLQMKRKETDLVQSKRHYRVRLLHWGHPSGQSPHRLYGYGAEVGMEPLETGALPLYHHLVNLPHMTPRTVVSLFHYRPLLVCVGFMGPVFPYCTTCTLTDLVF